MSHEMKYDEWFLIHSGAKKRVNPTKGGFLSTVKDQLRKTSKEIIDEEKAEEKKKEKEKAGKEKQKEKGTTLYERWFYRNCDNNNMPDLSASKSMDYDTWFCRHSCKKAPEPKYASAYEAWFYKNCDNRNLPQVNKIDLHDYATWFDRHCIKREKCKCDKSYASWFERNCDSKNPGVIPPPVLTYCQWFKKHATPSKECKCSCECKKPEPYDDWFKRHSI